MSFSPESFEKFRIERGVIWGRPVRVLSRTTSTNDEALNAIEGDARTGIIWVAEEQTAGRGRRGQTWIAAPGTCLMFSTLVRYRGDPARLSGSSLVVGLSVRDALMQRFAAPRSPSVAVKWPNDVYVGEQKVAGVLVESRRHDGAWGLVIGVGVNTSTACFPPELPHATSLSLLGLNEPDRAHEALLADILKALQERLSRFLMGGLRTVHRELSSADFLFGRPVLVDDQAGTACGIDERGRLLLRTPDGTTKTFASGHVSLTG